MPFVRKVIARCLDDTLSDDEKIARINKLYNNDVENYDCTDITKLRKTIAENGDLLARGVIISEDGKEIHTTMIWKSEEAFIRFRDNPISLDYVKHMKDVGWTFEALTWKKN